MKITSEINTNILVMIILAVSILAVIWACILINIIVASRNTFNIIKRKGKRKLKKGKKRQLVANFSAKIIAMIIIGEIIINGVKNIYDLWQMFTMMEKELPV